jgi:hypothetical protein
MQLLQQAEEARKHRDWESAEAAEQRANDILLEEMRGKRLENIDREKREQELITEARRFLATVHDEAKTTIREAKAAWDQGYEAFAASDYAGWIIDENQYNRINSLGSSDIKKFLTNRSVDQVYAKHHGYYDAIPEVNLAKYLKGQYADWQTGRVDLEARTKGIKSKGDFMSPTSEQQRLAEPGKQSDPYADLGTQFLGMSPERTLSPEEEQAERRYGKDPFGARAYWQRLMEQFRRNK